MERPRRKSLSPEELAQRRVGSSRHTPHADAMADTEEDPDIWPSRMPSSVRRYHPVTQDNPQVIIQGKRRFVLHNGPPPGVYSSYQQRERQTAVSSVSSKPRMHWLWYAGVLMLVMLLGFVLISALVNWWQVYQDDQHYGRPRTFQVDQRVGHNDDQTPIVGQPRRMARSIL